MTTTKQQIWQNKINRVYCCCCRCILHLQQYSRRLNLFFFLTLTIFVLTTDCKVVCYGPVLVVSKHLLMQWMSKRPLKRKKYNPDVQTLIFPTIILIVDMISKLVNARKYMDVYFTHCIAPTSFGKQCSHPQEGPL